jgi:hypothetical protein
MNPRHVVRLILALALSTGVAAAAEPWFHVHVDGADPDERVRLSFPLSLVRTMISGVETDEIRDGKIQLDDSDLDGVDLRAMLEAVRDADDSEFIRVRDVDSDVRVAKANGVLMVQVEPRHDDSERVLVQVPMEVVEALLASSETGNELDVRAALDVLATVRGRDLVNIRGDGESVRIWVDDSPDTTD